MKSNILLLLLLLLGGSCTFNKYMKDPDWKVRYHAAVKYYDKEDYYRAGLLLEDLVPIIKGDTIAEKIQLYYAYCHYYQKQYDLGAHYFRSFFDTYSRSPKAEEALFMQSKCLFKVSPRYDLDQESSKDAINYLQGFINRFPSSSFLPEVTEMMATLRDRLEKKAYDNAKLYLKLSRYKSAVVAFDNFRKDFPDSKMREEIEYLRIKAQYDYAKNSAASKQEERFKSAMEFYVKYIDHYPNSKFLKDAENLYTSSEKGIDSAKKQLALEERLRKERLAEIERLQRNKVLRKNDSTANHP